MKRRDLLLIPAAALGVMIANVAISFGMVWVYSIFISPGLPFADYEAFAARAAPLSSVVAGIPLMLIAGFLLSGVRQRRGALLAAGASISSWIWLGPLQTPEPRFSLATKAEREATAVH